MVNEGRDGQERTCRINWGDDATGWRVRHQVAKLNEDVDLIALPDIRSEGCPPHATRTFVEVAPLVWHGVLGGPDPGQHRENREEPHERGVIGKFRPTHFVLGGARHDERDAAGDPHDVLQDPLEADHRRHAEIENAIRDLKYGMALNHLPSGKFGANWAWLAIRVMRIGLD